MRTKKNTQTAGSNSHFYDIEKKKTATINSFLCSIQFVKEDMLNINVKGDGEDDEVKRSQVIQEWLKDEK